MPKISQSQCCRYTWDCYMHDNWHSWAENGGNGFYFSSEEQRILAYQKLLCCYAHYESSCHMPGKESVLYIQPSTCLQLAQYLPFPSVYQQRDILLNWILAISFKEHSRAAVSRPATAISDIFQVITDSLLTTGRVLLFFPSSSPSPSLARSSCSS